ncbi:MAG: alpha/beta fold hydrolase [Candidatus Binatia bacterium]
MPTDGRFSANGLSLHYLEWGSRNCPAVLFLHGGSAHAHWWDFVLPHLEDTYRCVALDLRGHGDSGRPPDGDYALEAHAGDIAAAIDALQLTGCALVGHSFGGFVAMRYAGYGLPTLAALAVVDSRARILPRSARYLEALCKLPHPRYVSAEDAVERFRLLPAATTAGPDVLAHIARHSIVADGNGTLTLKFDRRALTGARPQDLAPYLTAARCPILAVRAARSAIVDAAALAEYRAAASHVELAEIADAHHHVMLDRPEALAAVLRDFLDRHLRRS